MPGEKKILGDVLISIKEISEGIDQGYKMRRRVQRYQPDK